MTVIGEAYVQLKPDEAGFGQAVNGIIHKVFTALGPAGIALGVGAALGGVLLDVGEKFQKMYNTIAQTTGATGAALQGLEKDARNVFSTAIGANFQNVADTLSEVAIRTGLTGPPLDKLTKQFIELAKMDPTANVQDLTAVFGQFNIAAADQSRELDVLFKAHQVAGVSVSQLTSDMKTAAAVTQPLGLSLDQTAAMIAQIDKLGLPASKTMMALSSEFGKAAKAGMDPLGVIGALIQKIKEAPDATSALTVAMGTFGLSARSAATFVEGVRSGMTNFGDTLGKITSGKDGIDATAKATATLGDRFKLFKNDALVAIEPVAAKVLEFADKVMERLPGAFHAVADAMRPFVEGFKDFADFLGSHREIMIGTLTGLAAVIGSVVIPALAGLAVSLATVIGEAVIAAAPFIAIGLAVAALATGIVYLVENWDAIWKKIKEIASGAINAVEGFLEGILHWVKTHWLDILLDLVFPPRMAVILIREHMGEIERVFDNGFNAVKRLVLGWVDDTVGFFERLPGQILRAVESFPGLLINAGKNFGIGLYNGIVSAAVAVFNWFIALPGKFLDLVKDAGRWLWDTGKHIIEGLFNGIKDAIANAPSVISQVGGGLVTGFTKFFGISSPSTVFHAFGVNMMEGLANGIASGSSMPNLALRGLVLGGPTLAIPNAATATNTQLLSLLQAIRNNTDPNHPIPTQQNQLLSDIKRNTDPNNAVRTPIDGTSSVAAVASIPFTLAR